MKKLEQLYWIIQNGNRLSFIPGNWMPSEKICIGRIFLSSKGYAYWAGGYTGDYYSWMLKEIAEELDNLNKAWKKYGHQKKP